MRTVTWVVRAGFALALGVLTAGCGGEVTAAGEATAKPSEDDAVASSLGWSVRDSTPYARSEHSGVIDTLRDRLLLLGGVANDMWQLPLTGERANQWRQFVPGGERPPGGHVEAVYDERNDRVLALFNRHDTGASRGELWTLSLGEAPSWQRIVTAGPDPGAELALGRIILHDGALLALGSGGTWSLDLRSMAWTRLGDAPGDPAAGPIFIGWGGEAFLLDAPRLRLVALQLAGDVWEMPLATGVWSSLGRGPYVSGTTPGIFDEAQQSLIFPGPLTQVFSLATNQWRVQERASFRIPTGFASATVDVERNRALYVVGPGSTTGDSLSEYRGNDTWQLLLDSFANQVLVPNARGAIHCAQSAWDPAREAVVSLRPRGHVPSATVARSLAARATWEELPIGDAPLGLGATLVYDGDRQELYGFGGYAASQDLTNVLARLPSKSGSRWEALTASGGPEPRSGSLLVYDSVERQLVVRGGSPAAGGPFDDTWAFSTATMTWRKLEPQGETPGPRIGEVGVYDPVGRRLIVWGGEPGDLDGPRFEDLHALSLDGEPTWTALNPVSELPVTGFGTRYAVYDAQGQRMIAMVQDGHELLVYALSLADTPTWHRFCAMGVSPDPVAQLGQPLLTDDGIFLAVANGAFKFDLGTPYCD